MSEDSKLRCDPEQYAMLQRCSDVQDIAEWNTWRMTWQIDNNHASLPRILLNGANLGWGYFKNINLRYANLRHANLEGTNLQNACFYDANLAGVFLVGSHLEGADFSAAIVDEETIIIGCSIDDQTNFTMVGLDSARIEPRLLAALKTNIRRIAWKKWYAECKAKRTAKQANSRPGLLSKILPPLLDNGLIFLVLPLLLLFALPVWGVCRIVAAVWRSLTQYGVTASFVRLFWWISDYGSSTKRVLGIFFLVALAFAVAYAAIDWNCPGVLKDIAPETAYKTMQTKQPTPYAYPQDHPVVWALQIGAFSLATMVTLGFGGINVRFVEASPFASGLAVVLVAFNLLCGYFLLAVLVTRIGILFQSLGPEQEVERTKGRSSGKAGKP